MAWGPAIIGGVTSLFGSASAAQSAKAGQEAANATNIALQKSQQGWEERMANTAYQRQAKDLSAAGFNPMLGYMQGHGAAVPDVQPARVESTTKDSSQIRARGVSEAVNSALDAYMKRAQVTSMQIGNVKTQNEADLAAAATQKTRAEADLIAKQAGVVVGEAQSRIGLNVSSAGRAEAEIKKLGVDVESLKASIAKAVEETKGVSLNNELVRSTMDAYVRLKKAEAGYLGAKADVAMSSQSIFDAIKGVGAQLGYGVDAVKEYADNFVKHLRGRYESAGKRYDFQMRGVK
ncbi:MAG: DNA pilot protein [Microvirus sp.]|nr:MAG: DNA pilot protein [Microvirus sp.]